MVCFGAEYSGQRATFTRSQVEYINAYFVRPIKSSRAYDSGAIQAALPREVG